jgi:hypothetical protein
MQLLPLTVTVDFRVILGPYSDHARAEHDLPSRFLAQRGGPSARLPNRWQQVSGRAHQLGIRERWSPQSGDTPVRIRPADYGQLWHTRKALRVTATHPVSMLSALGARHGRALASRLPRPTGASRQRDA